MYEQLKLKNQLCFRLYTASRLVTQSYHPFLAPLGLTYPQYLVLLVLWEQNNLLVSELCRRLMLDTNTLTPLLKRMEKEGLIIRTRGIADGRHTLISLTKKGIHLEEDAKNIQACLVEQWQGKAMDDKQMGDLVTYLDTIIDGLK